METFLQGAGDLLLQMGLPGLAIAALAWFARDQMAKVEASYQARLTELKENQKVLSDTVSDNTRAMEGLTEVVKASFSGRNAA